MTPGYFPYRLLFALTVASLLPSCSWVSEIFSSSDGKPTSSAGAFANSAAYPEQIRTSINGMPTGGQDLTENADDYLKKVESEGLILTDPDNPYKKIPELDKAIRGKKSFDWVSNFAEAKKDAVRNQKPLLLWFTDTRYSPNAIQQGLELFNTPEFSDWAEKNIIRFRIDANISSADNIVRTKRKNYLNTLTKHFDVKGYPRVFILTPDGQQVDDIRGYISGTQESLYRQIRNSSEIAMKHYRETQKKLIPQGFRTWHGTNGVNVFAKLYKFNPPINVILQEIDGGFIETTTRYLSADDRKWIVEEKKKWEEFQKKKS